MPPEDYVIPIEEKEIVTMEDLNTILDEAFKIVDEMKVIMKGGNYGK